jgi:SAM-dependent methyltransferase
MLNKIDRSIQKQDRLSLAQALISKGDYAKIYELLIESLHENKKGLGEAYLLGIAALQIKDFETAKVSLLKVTKSHTYFEPAWSALSISNLALGYHEEAFNTQLKASILEPGNVSVNSTLIRLSATVNGLKNPHTHARRLFRISPNILETWRGFVLAETLSHQMLKVERVNPKIIRAAKVCILCTPNDFIIYGLLSRAAISLDLDAMAESIAQRAYLLTTDFDNGTLVLLESLSKDREAMITVALNALPNSNNPLSILNVLIRNCRKPQPQSTRVRSRGHAGRGDFKSIAIDMVLDLASDAVDQSLHDDAVGILDMLKSIMPLNKRAQRIEKTLKKSINTTSKIPTPSSGLNELPFSLSDEYNTATALFGNINYYDVLTEIHQFLQPKVYLEIGLGSGDALLLSYPGCNAVGVDPEPLDDLFVKHPHISFFQGTSDKFFENSNTAAGLGCNLIDMAFIDGMHLYEYVLRDFRNTERLMAKGGVIFVHDLLPPLAHWTGRSNIPGYPWAGDTWKFFSVLERFRPDLDLSIIMAEPTGLGMVVSLDPSNTVLWERESEILASVKDDVFDFDLLWNKLGPRKIFVNTISVAEAISPYIIPASVR